MFPNRATFSATVKILKIFLNVPKTIFFHTEGLDPITTGLKDESIHLTLSILSGRHLCSDPRKGADCNTFVKGKNTAK